MARAMIDSTRARGALVVDPKTVEPGMDTFPERVLAWDEDATTLAIAAARALAQAPRAVLGPGIDAETFRVALDIAETLGADDPMAVARELSGPAIAVGCPPGTGSAIAALIDDGSAGEPAAPRDISPAPRLVSAARALQESRRIPPPEAMPDSPMGAYVPWGTWMEDLPARLRLIAQRCTGCARVMYPPRGACPACRSRAFEPVALADEAVVYAATRIGRGGAPSEFALEQAQVGAFWVGVVEWPSAGVRVTARLSGFEDVEPAIGDRVQPVVRRLFEQEGRVRYGVKFTVT